jgi:ankyrin repeat protein
VKLINRVGPTSLKLPRTGLFYALLLAATFNTHKTDAMEPIEQSTPHAIHTTLIKAAENNDCAAIQRSLDNGADINTTDMNKWTPLMWAVVKGHSNAVQCLLNNPNIAINQQDHDGNTALMIALLLIHRTWTTKKVTQQTIQNVIQLLLDAGADPEIANNKGNAPLHVAQSIDDAEILRSLHKAILKKHNTATPFYKNTKTEGSK